MFFALPEKRHIFKYPTGHSSHLNIGFQRRNRPPRDLMAYKVILSAFLLMPTLSWAQITLKSLSDTSSMIWTPSDLPTVFIFFQKDCSACKKQMARLNCLKKDKDLSLLLMGGFSKESDLREEVKKIRTPYPFYYADTKVLKYFKISDPVTPQILVLTSSKDKKFIGTVSCSRLKRTIEKFHSKKQTPEA